MLKVNDVLTIRFRENFKIGKNFQIFQNFLEIEVRVLKSKGKPTMESKK
jgi:hypothetical protein